MLIGHFLFEQEFDYEQSAIEKSEFSQLLFVPTHKNSYITHINFFANNIYLSKTQIYNLIFHSVSGKIQKSTYRMKKYINLLSNLLVTLFPFHDKYMFHNLLFVIKLYNVTMKPKYPIIDTCIDNL